MGRAPKYSEDFIIAALKRYAGILGEPPGQKQMRRDSKVFDWLPEPQTVVYRFGSWRAGMEAANLPVKGPNGRIPFKEPPPSPVIEEGW